jgi:two-component system, OmpR family, alkaline phosphatase synthesis response regulator PhoP
MAKILIIEDEESILMPLEDNLRLEGYEVASAADGLAGLAMAAKGPCDLIILDIMLPRMDGFEVCRRLRQDRVTTPILMLTAKSQEIDRVLGLELGADDYVTKPFSSREILARIKAILRRSQEPPAGADTVRFGDVDLDFIKYEARKAGRPIPLTALEFALLRFLVRNKGRVVQRNEILDSVWGKDVYVDARTVDKHISLLRRKLEADAQDPKYILGVRGVGYKFMG